MIPAINIWCQGYQSIFGNDSTTWYQAREAIDRIDLIVIKSQYDTLIKTKNYIRVSIDGIIEKSAFFLREDTTPGKLWILDLENAMEYLLMDLSLNRGDTFRVSTNFSYQDSLAIVDSVFISEGRKHIILNYDLQIGSNIEKLRFIEGIGPGSGLIYQINTLDDNIVNSHFLLCVFKDSERVFKDEQFSTENCIYTNGQVNIFENVVKGGVSIYPNPGAKNLQIVFPLESNGKLEVYNINGQLVDSYSINSITTFNLPVNDYINGIYLLIFKTDFKTQLIGKLIKND